MTKNEKEEKRAEIKNMMRRNAGITKASELYTLGLDYRKLQRFVEEGFLRRVKNGYYGLVEEEPDEEELILGLYPDGVLCMETALYYYGYLKQRPFEWRLAVDKNTSKVRFRSDYPQVIPYYTEEKVLSLGVQEISFAGGKMKIYEKERLICDCMKYEDKMDKKDWKEAMLHYLQEEEKDVVKLLAYAKERKVLKKVQERIGVWI